MKTESPIEIVFSGVFELASMITQSITRVFLPILTFERSPLTTVPHQSDDPSPTSTSPITVALGATQSLFKSFGKIVELSGIQRVEGTRSS